MKFLINLIVLFPLTFTQCQKPYCREKEMICTKEYAPVKCKDGKVYSNECEAERACQHSCELVEGK